MYLGKTLFAQVMDFLPWKTFHRITVGRLQLLATSRRKIEICSIGMQVHAVTQTPPV
jgi:hypothetical protein